MAVYGCPARPTAGRRVSYGFRDRCGDVRTTTRRPYSPAATGSRRPRVPQDMGVVGFDGPPEARWPAAPLTAVRPPLSDTGRVAALAVPDLARSVTPVSPRVEPATRRVVRASASRVPGTRGGAAPAPVGPGGRRPVRSGPLTPPACVRNLRPRPTDNSRITSGRCVDANPRASRRLHGRAGAPRRP
ncbi:substrate-binding domain-containing protein [Streptomyces sp. ALB3]|uniref:substrate-binding domain-containing protein n=1 Tax=Streptomyces sp. ALB3 TaxID=3374278 RepID=UPI0037B47909